MTLSRVQRHPQKVLKDPLSFNDIFQEVLEDASQEINTRWLCPGIREPFTFESYFLMTTTESVYLKTLVSFNYTLCLTRLKFS